MVKIIKCTQYLGAESLESRNKTIFFFFNNYHSAKRSAGHLKRIWHRMWYRNYLKVARNISYSIHLLVITELQLIFNAQYLCKPFVMLIKMRFHWRYFELIILASNCLNEKLSLRVFCPRPNWEHIFCLPILMLLKCV